MDAAGNGTADGTTVPRKRSLLRRVLLLAVLLVVVAGLVAYAIYWWTEGRFLEGTDDAYLRADQVAAAPRVSGYVAELLVADNQDVVAGQPLIRIDPSYLAATLQKQEADRTTRQADVVVAQQQIEQQQAAVQQARARLAGDQADARYAEREVARYRGLVASGAENAEKLAQMLNQQDKAEAALRADGAAVSEAERRAAVLTAQAAQSEAQVQAASASVAQARLDVDNTTVRAGIDGRVGDRTVQVGQYVQAGTRLLTVVPVGRLYVVANFKETQIARMRVGQEATVTIDALGGRTVKAVVQSFSPGTGSEFALLPPENATGNFTKIVQRVPVRLQLQTDADTLRRLVSGLSVVVSVDTRDPAPPARQS